jgi:hypothetical protein
MSVTKPVFMSGTTPILEVKAQMETIPAHKAEHARRRREHAQWLKMRTKGFIDVHREINIDDGRIANRTQRNFFELKSFGQTLDMSLDKAEIMSFKARIEHVFIEERDTPFGRTEKVQVKPRHLSVWEYNPRTSQKRRITR